MAEKKSLAVLLVNLGSPTSSSRSSVRRFLKEFLWDPRVVSLPRSIWWIILNVFVLPFRPRRSAAAYRKIWTDKGSPLIYLSNQLKANVVRDFAGDDVVIELAMRYGKPSIGKKLNILQQYEPNKIVIIPLYPQFSSTTTASVFDAVFDEIKHWRNIPDLNLVSSYYDDAAYIAAIADSVKNAWEIKQQAEKLLISFHGLPEILTKWGDPYFKQCQNTAALIAEKLQLQDNQWMLVFQSRFGKAEWLKPYCIESLTTLGQQGCKNIDIICPGFSVDCLETLEEIALTNKEIFIAAGGESYHYIQALNDSEEHVAMLAGIIRKQFQEGK